MAATARQSRVQRVEAEFGHALARAYRDPGAARAVWDRLRATHGGEAAAVLVRRDPGQLGGLTAGDGISARSARFHAAQAVVVGAALEGARHGISPPAERGAADETAERARVRVRVAQRDRAREGTPHLDALDRSIAAQMQRLAPPELAQLTQVVTAPQAALASRIRATVRDLALGRDQGYER